MLGPQDLWVALALGMFFFGAKKLPELSRSLGQAVSEFKKGLSSAEPTGRPDDGPARLEVAQEPPSMPARIDGAAERPEGSHGP